MPTEITLEVNPPSPVDVITNTQQGPTGPTGAIADVAFNAISYAPADTLRDGTVDWRPYIQAAIDACTAAGGGVVYLRDGIYKVGYGVHVKSNVWLRGAGVGATTLKLADGGATGLNATQIYQHLGAVVSVYECTKARVSDLSIDGNRANNNLTNPTLSAGEASRKDGVWVGGRFGVVPPLSADCVLENLHITECCAEGVEIAFTKRCYVRNCYSAKHGTGPGAEQWMSNAIMIAQYCEDCHVLDCVGGEDCVHGGFEIFTGGAPSDTGNNTIERCRTTNIIINTSADTREQVYTRLVDNHIDSTIRATGGNGVSMVGMPSFLTISGNTIRYYNGNGIANSGSATNPAGDDTNGRQTIITDNLIEWAGPSELSGQGSGIALRSVDDLVISGNTIRAMGGLWLSQCGGASIINNTIVGRQGSVLNYWAPNDGSREGSDPMDVNLHPRYGIDIEKCRDCIVMGNVVRGYHWSACTEDAGVAEASKTCTRNVITRNNFFNNWTSVLASNNQAPTSIWADNVLRP